MKKSQTDNAGLHIEPLKQSGSLSSYVSGQLEAMICSGKIAVDSKLPTETALCDMFGVSRTVIREAIAKLKSIGLVDTRQGVGTTVISSRPMETFFASDITPKTVEDILCILELRMSIEVKAAELAALRRDEKDLAQMLSCLEKFTQAIKAKELARKEDLDFHCAVARATKNVYFVKFYDQMNKNIIPREQILEHKVDQFATEAYLNKVNEEHMAIYQAIEARDCEAAEKSMYNHLYRAYHMYEQYQDK
jgi:DNA-binding FadR family transcriptional regulator